MGVGHGVYRMKDVVVALYLRLCVLYLHAYYCLRAGKYLRLPLLLFFKINFSNNFLLPLFYVAHFLEKDPLYQIIMVYWYNNGITVSIKIHFK